MKESMVARFPKYWSGPRSDLNLKVYVESKYMYTVNTLLLFQETTWLVQLRDTPFQCYNSKNAVRIKYLVGG